MGGVSMVAKDVMETELETVHPDDRLAHAAELLEDYHHSIVPVIDEAGKLVGLLSEVDLLAFVLPVAPRDMQNLAFMPKSYQLRDLQQQDLREARVREAMTSDDLVTASEDEPIAQIALAMVRHNVAHVPVLAEGKLIGQVCRNALIRQLVHPCLGIVCE